ncbi:iron-sulfur cluster co-chaperone protein HscB [Rhinophrynus dorsalis]
MEPARAVIKCCSIPWIRRAVLQWGISSTTMYRDYHSPCSTHPFLPCVSSGRKVISRPILQINNLSSYCYKRTFCTSTQSRLCWSCQTEVGRSELFCPSCTSLQPPDESKDFFQVLDCKRTFNIDIQELQRKYRNLQRLLHPDFFSKKSQAKRNMSEKQSTLVNKAYHTLLSPLKRGIYLLSLRGITFKEGADSGVDADFLFEILELNQTLNDTNTIAEIEEIGNFVDGQCESLTEEVRNAFQQGALEEAKILLAKLKYFSNIQDQVKKKIIP